MAIILEEKHNLISNEVNYENISKDISISVLLSTSLPNTISSLLITLSLKSVFSVIYTGNS